MKCIVTFILAMLEYCHTINNALSINCCLSMNFLLPIIFSQEWIHKITDSLLIKSKVGETKGRDNYGRTKLSKQPEQTSVQLVKKENKLIDENEEIYGIGYLNPAFDESQCNVRNTPESSPIDIVHRSRKSVKSEKVKAKIVDVSKTVRRKLDMSSVPDVVQTSQPQIVHIDDDPSSSSPDSDAYVADEEFFLSKHSSLFSQVSSNTLVTTDSKPFNMYHTQMNPFHIVEVKEMEIVKSVASPEDHVILPSANVSVGLMPQVVERVEIVEDTETEPESVDTDTEDKETRGKICSTNSAGNQIVNKKRELIPILKKKRTIDPYAAKNVKKLTLKLDIESIQSEHQTSYNKSMRIEENVTKIHESISMNSQQLCKISKTDTIEKACALKDKDSIAEYLILDDNETRSKLSSKTHISLSPSVSDAKRRKTHNKKESTPLRDTDFSKSRNENQNLDSERSTKSLMFRRARSISKDDTLEDCESFYGSDKETDDILIFSDDTEIDVGSSSSEGEDPNLGEHVEHLLGKVILIALILPC